MNQANNVRGDIVGERVPPRAAALIEALRDIGYSLEAAVADILDNSVTAGARQIEIRYGWDGTEPWIAVVDDGAGMALDELVEAMRPGSRDPRDARARGDLGRFGLGLKTASFSQCRCLTVVTRQAGQLFARRWDLDEVSARDDWILLTVDNNEVGLLPAVAMLGERGTYVLWQKLDRLDLGTFGNRSHEILNERAASIRRHLSLVFHRYLAGEPGLTKVIVRVNGEPIDPFDPFNSRNPATIQLPEERVDVEGGTVSIQPFILPHHTKVSPEEYERLAGEEGYLRGQGFYVYRNRRLIRHGTWFRLARQDELTKLARVRIDIPNTLDHPWTIDVRKSRANPPEAVRMRMRQVVERIRGSARRPYTHRGSLVVDRHAAPVWQRRVHNDKITYEINLEHPFLEDLHADLEESVRTRMSAAFRMIGSAFPAPMFFADFAADPKRADNTRPDESLLRELAGMMAVANPGMSPVEFRELLLKVEPFASWPNLIEAIV